jgi:hypothetical protein
MEQVNLFKYPQQEGAPEWLARYNSQVDSGDFGTGTFGLAFDVWRNGEHLFRSYRVSQAEPMDTWCRRNLPQIANPEHNKTAMGANVPAMDRFLVPTMDAFDTPMSLATARTIVAAALATARWPHAPDEGIVVPKDNALRQRLYNEDRDWFNLKLYDPENGIAIRAIFARLPEQSFMAQQSKYLATLWERPDSNLKGALDPASHEIVMDTCDLDNVKARKPILKEAKRLFFLVGQNGRVIHDDYTSFTYRCGNLPYDFKVERIHDFAKPEIPTDKRTLDV